MINISIKKPKPVLVMVHNASKGLRGVGLSGVILDKDGNLIFTMSDGTVHTIKGYSQDLVNTTNEINNIKEEVSTIANNAANSAKEAKETADSIKQEYDRVEGATNSGLALVERSVLYGINRVKEATKACKSDALANIELAHKDAIDDIAIRRLEALQDISEVLGGQLAYFDEVSVDNDTLTFHRGSGDTHKLTIDYVQHAYEDVSGNIITDTYATKQELNTEASARKSADSTLQSNINTEASTRKSADDTLQKHINDEISARKSADSTLQSNIDAEAAARKKADENLSNTSVSTTTLTVTGETSVPTANIGNSSKAIANTEFVQKTVANLVNSAPDTLNTLDELAQALGDDPNFATTMATELGKKANKADVANTYLDKLSKTEQVVTAPIKGTLNGNASSATKLETARTINIQDATSAHTGTGASFNGTANATIKLPNTIDANITGNASSATKLETARTISVTDADGTNTGTGASFDGTANATVKLPATIKANLTGNADTANYANYATDATNANYATKATNDGDGNNIASTYLPAVVGAVVAFAGSTTPQGWLLCDGSAVSRTDYAALYAVIGTTYGAGDGSTTFNLPNLIDKFVEGSATAGTVKSAGLPNITGMATYISSDNADNTQFPDIGALYWNDYSNIKTQIIEGTGKRDLRIDASRSSAIYGKSSTVQPPALTMRYIIKY